MSSAGMEQAGTVASRIFTMADQHWFAGLSGDANPLHVDPLVARRSTAGAPVVHGTHGLLWCLESIAAGFETFPAVAGLRVNFDRFVLVGDRVEAAILSRDASGMRAEIRSDGVAVVTLLLSFGPPKTDDGGATIEAAGSKIPFEGDVPDVLTLEQMQGMTGQVAVPLPDACARAFPFASRLLGRGRVAGLNGLTRLVGMVCPGLHSIYNAIALKTCDAGAEDGRAIAYRVKTVDMRYRRVVEDVAGCGWAGTITCSGRHPPTQQPSTRAMAGCIGNDAFVGTTTLVVGGSRGLGELAAKLIAAGGGAVVLTWLSGEADARLVVDDIRDAGGQAEALHYNVRHDAETQLAPVDRTFTHFCYFATPAINDKANVRFNAERYASFSEVYVTGFAQLAAALHKRAPEGKLAVLYPSSTAVDERPRGMTEYAMAKAAGEVLCADFTAHHAGLRVVTWRFPRLATDQTATLQSVETEDAVAVVSRALQALAEA